MRSDDLYKRKRDRNEENNMLVSIVIPCYNSEHSIKKDRRTYGRRV